MVKLLLHACRARAELSELFARVIRSRRADPERNAREADLLASFCQARYSPAINGGRELTEGEITGMLIAVLFAGQHTSSITSSWTGLFMMRHPVSAALGMIRSVLIAQMLAIWY